MHSKPIHYTMKTIGVNKGTRDLIEDVAYDGESVDETLNRLMDIMDKEVMYLDPARTNINMSDETYERLKSFRMYPSETNMSLIYRLITHYENVID